MGDLRFIKFSNNQERMREEQNRQRNLPRSLEGKYGKSK